MPIIIDPYPTAPDDPETRAAPTSRRLPHSTTSEPIPLTPESAGVSASGSYDRPPLHVFEYRGERLMIDVDSHQVFRVENLAAFDFLRKLELTGDEALALEYVLERHSFDNVSQLLKEVAVLREAGCLTPEPALSDRGREALVGDLLRHHPRNLMLLVTESCNLKCVYCYEVSSGFHAPRHLRGEEAEVIVDEYLAATGPRREVTITFFGGEPLLNFSIVRRIVERAKSRAAELGKEVAFTITTNGTLLTSEIADYLVQHRFGVMLSLDGDEEGHDRWRVDLHGRGTHERVVAAARMLLAKQEAAGVRPLKLRATMNAGNTDRDRIQRFFESVGRTRVSIGANVGTAFDKSGGALSASDYDELDAAEEREVDTVLVCAQNQSIPPVGLSILKGLRALYEHIKSRVRGVPAVPKLCGVGRNMLALTPGGDLYPCHRYVGMKEWLLGRRSTGGLDRNRVANYYERLLSAFEHHCVKCWMRFKCGGQCPWYISHTSGSFIPPDAPSCEKIRRTEERTTWLFVHLLDRFPAWIDAHVLKSPVEEA